MKSMKEKKVKMLMMTYNSHYGITDGQEIL